MTSRQTTMRISDDEQNCRDLDWYCVDIQGRVGHFASAGFKQVPQSVAESAEDLASLHEFFSSLPAIPNAHVLDDRLTSEHRTERCTCIALLPWPTEGFSPTTSRHIRHQTRTISESQFPSSRFASWICRRKSGRCWPVPLCQAVLLKSARQSHT